MPRYFKNYVLSRSAVGLLLLLILLTPQAAEAVWTVAVGSVDTPLMVGLPTTQLLRMGCVEPTAIFGPGSFGDTILKSIEYPDSHGHVRSVDPSSVSKLDRWEIGVFCPLRLIEGPVIQRAKVNGAVTDPLYKVIISIQNFMYEVTGNAGLWLMNYAGKVMSFMLSQSSYINHPFVQIGWPFLQGIANVGFLLALLFIAAATTLQLEDWSFRKALPRLLLAALMINFSLVIGAIFIDSSRVLMAIMTRMLGGPDLDKISVGLIKNSGILDGLLDASGAVHAPGNYAWTIPLSLLQANILIYALAIGMILIAAALVARHVLLILLLIFSPLAYLALAFPNTKSWATKWWTEFLKWVFYGPVLLFFLLLITVAGTGFNIARVNQDDPIFSSILQIGLTTGLLAVAYKVGRGFAGKIGEAAIDFTTKWGKQLPGMAYRNPGKTAALLAAAAGSGGLGALLVGGGAVLGKRFAQGSYLQGRDFVKPVAKTLYKGVRKHMPLGRTFFGPERDEKGNLLKGEVSFGDRWGRNIAASTGLYKKGADVVKWEYDMFNALKNIKTDSAGNFTEATFNDIRKNEAYTRFDVKQVGTAMDGKQASAILQTALQGQEPDTIKDFNRLWDMVRSEYAYNNIGEEDRIAISKLNIDEVVEGINKKRTARGKGEKAVTDSERSQLDRLVREIKNTAKRSRDKVSDPSFV